MAFSGKMWYNIIKLFILRYLSCILKKVQTAKLVGLVNSYYDKETKQSRTATIRSLGYLDELQKQYDDPISFFTEEVRKMNKENSTVNLNISLNETMPLNYNARKNFGYAALSKIYHDLEIDKFIKNKQRYSKEEYDANSILKLLVYSRVLFPASKKKTFENKDIFFEKFDFSLDDIYRSLSLFNKHCEALLLWIHEHIKKLYNRNTELVYYDVTNYYFEIDKQDELRRKGVSKEHCPRFYCTDGIVYGYKWHTYCI